jgi:hypothetical protein
LVSLSDPEVLFVETALNEFAPEDFKWDCGLAGYQFIQLCAMKQSLLWFAPIDLTLPSFLLLSSME